MAVEPRLLEALPTLPGAAATFVKMCDDPDAGVAQVAAVASLDPALLARILQVANSPFYGTRDRVTDVRRAASLIGLRNLKMLGVGFVVAGHLWAADSSPALRGLVGASTLSGAAARSFSLRLGSGREEESFAAGLLAFVGELALLRVESTGFAELWESTGGLPSLPQQRDRTGTDGVELGEHLLAAWGIPEPLIEGIRARRDDIATRTDVGRGVHLASLGFGTGVAEALLGGRSLDALRTRALVHGIDATAFANYWGEFRAATRRASRSLGLEIERELDDLVSDAREAYEQHRAASWPELEHAQAEISILRADAARLEALSLHDSLTGIANRAAYERRIREAIARHIRAPGPGVGLVLFDLDGFKSVNDRFGHLVGDQALVRVARAGESAARRDEMFARLGGDEFALVVEAATPEDPHLAGQRLATHMEQALHEHPSLGFAGVSFGGAHLAQPSEDLEHDVHDLFRAADDELYARKRGRQAA